MAFDRSADQDDDLDPCNYCGTTLQMAEDDWVFVEASWGTALRHGKGSFTFCTQEHAASYFAENTLPDPTPDVEVPENPPRRLRFRGAGIAVLVLVNAAFYVLGLVTWLRWIWS